VQAEVADSGAVLSDVELAMLLHKHAGLAIAGLQQDPGGGRAVARARPKAGGSKLSLANFVERCRGHLELEEEEEVAQAEVELTSYSVASAQVQTQPWLTPGTLCGRKHAKLLWQAPAVA
jgi:hypothetical protein